MSAHYMVLAASAIVTADGLANTILSTRPCVGGSGAGGAGGGESVGDQLYLIFCLITSCLSLSFYIPPSYVP